MESSRRIQSLSGESEIFFPLDFYTYVHLHFYVSLQIQVQMRKMVLDQVLHLHPKNENHFITIMKKKRQHSNLEELSL